MNQTIFLCLFVFSLFCVETSAFSEEKADVFVQLGNMGPPQSGSISPDGKLVLSAGVDQRIVLWSAESGREIRRFDKQDEITYSVVFTPDGKQALSGGSDKLLKLWDILTGKVVRTFEGHLDTVVSVAISPDGAFALSGGADNTMKLWEVSSGKMIRSYEVSGSSPVAFSPDGKSALSKVPPEFGYGDSLKLWDVASGETIRVFSVEKLNKDGLQDQGMVSAIAFSSDGAHLLSAADEEIRVWDIKSGELLRTIKGHSEGVVSITFSPNGQHILSGGHDKKLKLWNASSGKLERTFDSNEWISFGAFSPSGKEILSGGGTISRSGEMKLWNVESGKVVHHFRGFSNAVSSISMHPDNTQVLSGGDDGSIHLWDIESGKVVHDYQGHAGSLWSVQVSRDGDGFLSAGSDASVKRWSLEDGHEIKSLNAGQGALPWTAFSSDQNRLLTTDDDKSIKLWNLESGENILNVPGGDEPPSSLGFSPDGKMFVSGGTGYAPLTEKQQKQLKEPFSFGVVLTPIGEVAFWDAKSGKKLFSSIVDHKKPVKVVLFSPDGKYVASAGEDGVILLWDVKRRQVSRKFLGHTSSIESLAFTADGKFLFSGSGDQTIRMWEVESGQEIRSFKGHLSYINTLAVSSDGRRLISGSYDGTQRLWDVASGRELLKLVSFTDGEWIVITPEGYYNSSLNGHKYLNVRIGNKVYGIDQFYDVFYRPDIVSAKLAGEDISEMITLTLDEAISNPPPSVSLLSVPEKSSKEMEKISYQVDATGGGIGEVRVFHNGKLVKSDGFIRKPPESMMGTTAVAMNSSAIRRSLRGLTQAVVEQKLSRSPIITEPKDDPFASSIEIEPIAGENEVSIVAFNAQNSVQSLMKRIHFTSTRKPVPPRLHILAIGIDKYLDKGSTLKFAAKDARDMAAKFKEKAESSYGKNNVFMDSLFDEQATREGILAKLDEISAKVKPTDHFVLFVASHGVLLGDQYYMVTHDYDGSLKPDRLISSNEIVDLSKRIKALSQLYILDTCHAGGMDGVISGLYDARMSVLAKKMGLHIFASSNSFEEALDGYRGNGLFTHNLLDGLNNNAGADANKDKEISLVELGRFSQQQTKAIAKGLGHQQEPMIINFGQDRTLYQLQ